MWTHPCDCRVLLGDLAFGQTEEGDAEPRHCVIYHSSLEIAVRAAPNLRVARTVFSVPSAKLQDSLSFQRKRWKEGFLWHRRLYNLG